MCGCPGAPSRPVELACVSTSAARRLRVCTTHRSVGAPVRGRLGERRLPLSRVGAADLRPGALQSPKTACVGSHCGRCLSCPCTPVPCAPVPSPHLPPHTHMYTASGCTHARTRTGSVSVSAVSPPPMCIRTRTHARTHIHMRTHMRTRTHACPPSPAASLSPQYPLSSLIRRRRPTAHPPAPPARRRRRGPSPATRAACSLPCEQQQQGREEESRAEWRKAGGKVGGGGWAPVGRRLEGRLASWEVESSLGSLGQVPQRRNAAGAEQDIRLPPCNPLHNLVEGTQLQFSGGWWWQSCCTSERAR